MYSRHGNRHGVALESASLSKEAESRTILVEAVVAPPPLPELNLYDQIRAHIEPSRGIDLELPAHTPSREPPTFG